MKQLLLCLLMSLPALTASAEEIPGVRHKIVAIEKDRFHAWPANNGVWQWGDEILVGFTQGDFMLKRGHNIAGRQESLLARSRDGGETWTMFDPKRYLDDDNEQFLGGGKKPLTEPMKMTNDGFALRIFATGYHGNDDPEGGFFFSNDRGAKWQGPFTLNGLKDSPDLKDKLLSPRTDYLVQSDDRCLIFISAHRDDKRFKRIACIKTTDGGKSFEFVSWVTPETREYSGIMCQTVQLSDDEFVLAYRKIYAGSEPPDEIELYGSSDGCQTWKRLSMVKEMHSSSNPPALVKLTDGRLCCVYGDRHVGQIQARYSEDGGKTWGPELVIRDDFQAMAADPDSQRGLNADIGYPRLVQRTDGKLVAIYYWVTAKHPQQHIAASIFHPQ